MFKKGDIILVRYQLRLELDEVEYYSESNNRYILKKYGGGWLESDLTLVCRVENRADKKESKNAKADTNDR